MRASMLVLGVGLLVGCRPGVQPPPPVAVVVSPVAQPSSDPGESEPAKDIADPTALLGKPPSHAVVRAFVDRHNAVIELSSYPDSVYHVAKDRGFSLLEEDGVIVTVFLYAQAGYEDFERYPGPLPRGLVAGDRREDVLRRLGEPHRSSGPVDRPGDMGSIAGWDKYYEPELSLHVQYDTQGIVQLVTLMTPTSDPHR
jgi:hypothetical protein